MSGMHPIAAEIADIRGLIWRAEHLHSALAFKRRLCSAIAMASSTSMPRYRTVLSIFV
jgi:hypothetical protein